MSKYENPTIPHYVFIGGGSTGETAAGFKQAVDEGLVAGMDEVRVSAIVTTADDGGGTGLERQFAVAQGYDDIGGLGDARRSISALSRNHRAAALLEAKFSPEATPSEFAARTNQLFESIASHGTPISSDRALRIMRGTIEHGTAFYEWNSGKRLGGIAVGHSLVSSLAMEHGNVNAALEEAGRLLDTQGAVIAASDVSHRLIMDDGPNRIIGEHAIDEHVVEYPDDVVMSLTPTGSGLYVPLSGRAALAVRSADKVIIGPGSVYTSEIPALLPAGMSQALKAARSGGSCITLVGNLETQPTETHGWSGEKYIREVEKYSGRLSEVIYNDNTGSVPEAPVVFDPHSLRRMGDYRIQSTDLVDVKTVERSPHDLVAVRSNVKHHMTNLAIALAADRQTAAA